MAQPRAGLGSVRHQRQARKVMIVTACSCTAADLIYLIYDLIYDLIYLISSPSPEFPITPAVHVSILFHSLIKVTVDQVRLPRLDCAYLLASGHLSILKLLSSLCWLSL